MKARIATAAVAVAVLAAGSGALITVATASASETADATVSAQGATIAAKPDATIAAEPAVTVAAQPAATVLAPQAGGTTAPPPKPGKTTAPSGTPQPGRTTTPPKPGKSTTASPQPGKPGAAYKGSATFYSPGLGACGKVIKDSDHAVALDSATFGAGFPSSNCGRKVVITYKGKSITATVLDEARGAGRYGLDLTPGAFRVLAPLDKGKIDVTWRFAD
ncbi:RlpA-like double-psi beta-barrel domain-containing protein [Streptomyces sp. C]|uniref:RlpA-like double-psi beta-barrel domain-containing protein n=1 Tax=Streptomyces sp. C TaxID=253839 RepID=UPI0001B58720|nr:RlpA-like double-psi beta-barrel domain-containing protein [Streptomyces sp. C]